MAINLMKPPFVVDVGPCPGVYFSEEAYRDHLKRSGIQHPLDAIGDTMSLRKRFRKSFFDPFPGAAWIPRDPPPSSPPNKREKQGVPPSSSDEVRPIEAELCTPEEARTKFDEFFKHYQKGGGANLRVELVRGLPGIRFTLVCDWDDMG